MDGVDSSLSSSVWSGLRRDVDSPGTRIHNTKQYGVKILHEPPDNSAEIDIIAIHGLDGDRELSWTEPHSQVLWLRDILPMHISNARILTYGYDSATTGESELSHQTIMDHAGGLVTRLTLLRKDSAPRRPIVFLAHNIGGIVLKYALLQSSQAREGHLEDHKGIILSTYGILFLGTPHQGVADAIRRFRGAFRHECSHHPLLRHLERDSEYLQAQLTLFTPLSSHFDTKFIHETQGTILNTGNRELLVPRSSAIVPGAVNTVVVGLNCNHAGLIQFASGKEDGCRILISLLTDMVDKAPAKVKWNWDTMLIGPNAKICSTVQDTKDLLSTDKHQKLRDWIGSYRSRQDYEMYIEKRTPGTGQWILEEVKFLEWINGFNATLWCHGDPGSGKSVLSAIIFEHLEKCFKNSPTVAVIYIAFNYSAAPGYRALQAMKDILQQLLYYKVASEDCKELLQVIKDKGGQLSFKQALDACLFEMSVYGHVYMVFDGLDEAQDDDCSKVVLPYLEHPSVSVLAISRTVSSIPLALRKSEQLPIQSHPDDLEKHAKNFIDKSCYLHTASDLKRLREHVVKGSNDLFLILHLNLTMLEDQISPRDIWGAMDNLASTSSVAYDKVMARIKAQPPGAETMAYHIISCILHSSQTMNILELQYALAIAKQGPKAVFEEQELVPVQTLLTVTKGLLTLRKSTCRRKKMLGFIHATAKEYALCLACIPPLSFVGNIYFGYLMSHDFEVTPHKPLSSNEYDKPRESYPFLRHTVKNWAPLIKQVTEGKILKTAAHVLLLRSHILSVRHWQDSRTLDSPLHICIYHGLTNVLNVLLYSPYARECLHSNSSAAFYYAIQYANVAIARTIWKACGTPNVDENQKKKSLLHLAVGARSIEMVRFLVDEVRVRDGLYHLNCQGYTAFHCAVENGDVAIARTIWEAGSAQDIGEIPGKESPLHLAVGSFKVDMVQFLVDKVKVRNGFYHLNSQGYTAFHCAIENGNVAIARIIWEAGGAPNIDEVPREKSLLHLAVGSCKVDTVRFLVDEVKVRNGLHHLNSQGYTAFHCAIENDNVAIARTIWEAGGAPNVDKIPGKESLLHLAVTPLKVDMVRFLVDEVRVRDGLYRLNRWGYAAFHCAIESGNVAIARTIWKAGGAPNVDKIPGKESPLHLAVTPLKVDMVQFLVDEVRVRDGLYRLNRWGYTAFHCAIESGNVAIARTIWEAGGAPNVDSGIPGKQSFLHLAVTPLKVSTVRFLLGDGAIWEAGGGRVDDKILARESLLHLAVHARSIGMVQFLLDEVKVRDGMCCHNRWGYTAFDCAVENGNVAIARTIWQASGHRCFKF